MALMKHFCKIGFNLPKFAPSIFSVQVQHLRELRQADGLRDHPFDDRGHGSALPAIDTWKAETEPNKKLKNVNGSNASVRPRQRTRL
jgi:hypothetical protein